MKLKLYQGSTLLDATKAMIKAIDNSQLSVMHTIVVPDRFSLQCEKLILQLLPQKALFNVRVVNLTRFSVELLNKLGVKLGKGDVLSSGETLLLTARAVDNVAKDFKTLKKSGIDFCYELSKLISQFKSSGVSAEQLNSGAGGMAGNKYHDLALVYNEYEILLGDKLDANARLALLNEKLKDSQVLKGEKIYFAQFDSFTKAGYELIKTFAECADEVNISFAQPMSIGNDYIYEKDIYEKILKLSQEIGTSVNVEKTAEHFSPQKEALVRGLYSYEKVKCENKGFYNLYSCASGTEQVEAVAKLIRYQVYCGKSFKDIQIAVGGLSGLQSQIENVFTQYDIPYYIDSSLTADKSLFGNLIRSYFETVIMGYNYDKLIDLLTSPLANDDIEIIERCQHLAIEGKQRYKKYIEKDFKNGDILLKIEKSKTAKDFEDVVNDILSRAKDAHQAVLKALESKGELKARNINLQIEDIIKEAVSLITNERKEELSAGEYFKLLSLLLSFKQVSTVPTYVDGVFVGDATESYFGESDTLIVLNGENLPAINSDNGLLSDDDLKLNFSSPIEPTIRMINRRNRFKLFSLLTLAERRLFVFAQRLDEEGKRKESPTYIKNLNDIFSQMELRAGNVFFANKSENTKIRLLSAPLKTAENQNYNCEKEKISSFADLAFKNDRARVTQIEQYFCCPFKHFATYALKLKEFVVDKFEPRDIGNICHKGAELLLKEIMKKDNLSQFDRKNLTIFIDKNFNKIIKLERLEEKLEDAVEKQSLIKFIKNQMLDLFSEIVREQNASNFKPKTLEFQFDDFAIEGSGIKLIGKADRIDECGDYIRIIDYKTGTTGNILKELKFGQKLQLFLYEKFASQKFNKRCGGIFYFDAKFDYSKDDKDSTVLKGLVTNDNEVIKNLDKHLDNSGKSDIVSISISKKDGSYIGSAICKTDLNTLADYANRVTEKAVAEIMEGYIQPKPHQNSCRGCKYFALCGHEQEKGKRNLE